MPRLKQKTEDKSYKVLLSKINEKSTYYGIDRERLQTALRISERTLYNRKNNPEKFTFNELLKLGRVLHFTEKEYAEIFTGGKK